MGDCPLPGSPDAPHGRSVTMSGSERQDFFNELMKVTEVNHPPTFFSPRTRQLTHCVLMNSWIDLNMFLLPSVISVAIFVLRIIKVFFKLLFWAFKIYVILSSLLLVGDCLAIVQFHIQYIYILVLIQSSPEKTRFSPAPSTRINWILDISQMYSG